ncbi:hypothetical protein GDO86_013802 [Hymenochirus boettgeri]|uniref:Anticodon-binding domain-containing protein n=1 Tax=Hymenochirus boettgeri TaxID=247094 RepID=A0A8T2JUN4_9PIPI|nr:hypothetical protein GDO86_013802 [Hymenochirus boettgeri]
MLPTIENAGQFLAAASCVASWTIKRFQRRVNLFRDGVCYNKRQFAAESAAQKQDILTDLCQRRHFISGDGLTYTSLMQGSHTLGPLGVEMRRSLVSQWWNSVILSREDVLPIDTLHLLPREANLSKSLVMALNLEHIKGHILNQNVNHEQLISSLQGPAGNCGFLRQELLYGALMEYAPCLELWNKKLPFGLAEIGKCFHSVPAEENVGKNPSRTGERMVASLVWFSSPKTSGQWLDFWHRQRLQWWQKFAQTPSDFSSSELQDEEGRRNTLIQYRFPWGTETIEILCNIGDSVLTQMHSGSSTKLQARDGRKSVIPHLMWVSGNLDRGLLAFLFDALQQRESPPIRGKGLRREVLKLHPTLAPVKVAVDMGTGPAVDLRLVCQGLSAELREHGMFIWPGYMEGTHSPMEQLFTRYDEMGVLFTVLVSENTLENGLLQLRNRDTSLRETVHVSKVTDLVVQHITAAKKL